MPPSWKDERGEQVLERVYTEGYRLQETPISLNGNFHLHFYPQFSDYVAEFSPDIIHIDEEPYNLATWQALFFARISRKKSLFFSWQNIKRDYPPPFSWGERWMLHHVDYALVGTDSAGDVWRQKRYTGRMATIPPQPTVQTTAATRCFQSSRSSIQPNRCDPGSMRSGPLSARESSR